MKGQFVISLDFEKFWGVFDSLCEDNYKENLLNVDMVIDKLLILANQYNIKLTFATVGFLFNKNKSELIQNIPKNLPTYTDTSHNPYSLIDALSEDDITQKLHYAYEALEKIKKSSLHEIATHTYSHYYCLEDGQTLKQFDSDIKMAKKVALNLGVSIKSIVFPRNQVNLEYINICHNNGIVAFRGHEEHNIYMPKPKKETKRPTDRAYRILDAYWNFTGNHIYDLEKLKSENYIINIPSSYFLRPYNSKLFFLEAFKVNRVRNSMTKAAKNGYLFHLWFHPHNFGKNTENNFKNLENIFKTYQKLKKKYGFESSTMSELAEKLRAKEL